MSERILIVEDQFVEANNLQLILERAGYTVCGLARSVPEALELIEQKPIDLVLLDIYLKGPLTGIDLAQTLRQKNIAFVYLSANSTKQTLEAAKATRPYGFLVKPVRERDVLIMLEIAQYLHKHGVESVMRQQTTGTVEQEVNALTGNDHFYGITGKSAKLQQVLSHLRVVAPSDTSVLIIGESGTGKERIASCIHELSPRKMNPLVKVNCGALPSTLIESVLFGHERGAFTGATERKTGKFEQAHTGTLFLDEIGELSLDMQAKLLRTLQEREIERLGGNETIQIDTRIIAATNRNLEKEVAEGRFRLDLYYRLHVFPLLLPPLRERKEDIPLLARSFIEHFCKKLGRVPDALSDNALGALLNYHWPGNIRELEHVIERTVLLNEDKVIKHIALPRTGEKAEQPEGKIKTMEENERDHIIAALKKSNGKIFGAGGAAELLGINAHTLNSRIMKLGISKKRFVF
jgi:DNA-binding NtrC family response regulator